MSIRFAASPGALSSCLPPAAARRALRQPANDNAAEPQDLLLRAALRHFADHGLAAAQRARKQAEEAFFNGDREAYRWWLGICRTLDRRLALDLEQGAGARLS